MCLALTHNRFNGVNKSFPCLLFQTIKIHELNAHFAGYVYFPSLRLPLLTKTFLEGECGMGYLKCSAFVISFE